MSDKNRSKGSKDLEGRLVAKHEQEVYQQNAPYLSKEVSSRSNEELFLKPSDLQGKNILYILAGPTGAGKTTLYEEITTFFPEIKRAEKEHTRPVRKVVDSGRKYISKTKLRKKNGQGFYIFTYSVNYGDPKRKADEVRYGIPKTALVKQLKESDVVLTLTDPDSFEAFLQDEKVKKALKNIAHIVPVIVTTDNYDDLTSRLEYRICSAEEKQQRKEQAEPQWNFYNSVVEQFNHLIINNTPHKLKALTDEQIKAGDIPFDANDITFPVINDTIKKFSRIVQFYEDARTRLAENPEVFGVAHFNIRTQYIDEVSQAFFGVTYGKLVKELEQETPVLLNQSPELRQRVQKDVVDTYTVKDIFAKMQAAKVEYPSTPGIITRVVFNDFMARSSDETRAVSKKVFDSIFPYGSWVSDSVLRFSVTDKTESDSRGDRFAIDLKLM